MKFSFILLVCLFRTLNIKVLVAEINKIFGEKNTYVTQYINAHINLYMYLSINYLHRSCFVFYLKKKDLENSF